MQEEELEGKEGGRVRKRKRSERRDEKQRQNAAQMNPDLFMHFTFFITAVIFYFFKAVLQPFATTKKIITLFIIRELSKSVWKLRKNSLKDKYA